MRQNRHVRWGRIVAMITITGLCGGSQIALAQNTSTKAKTERLVTEGVILAPDTTGADTTSLVYVYFPIKMHGKMMSVKADLGAYGGLMGMISHSPVEAGIPAQNAVLRQMGDQQVFDSLEIGPVVEVNVPFTGAADFTDPPVGMPPLAGLLGNEVLSHYDFVFDGPAKRVRLYALPDGVAPPTAPKGDRPAWLPPGFTPADCVSMVADNKGVLISFTANGHPVRGIIDSGAWPTNMNMIAAKALGFTGDNSKVHPLKTPLNMNGVNANAEVDSGAITMMLGRQRLKSVPVTIFDQITIPGTGTEPVLDIGMNAVQDRQVLVSYSGRKVCVGTQK